MDNLPERHVVPAGVPDASDFISTSIWASLRSWEEVVSDASGCCGIVTAAFDLAEEAGALAAPC